MSNQSDGATLYPSTDSVGWQNCTERTTLRSNEKRRASERMDAAHLMRGNSQNALEWVNGAKIDGLLVPGVTRVELLGGMNRHLAHGWRIRGMVSGPGPHVAPVHEVQRPVGRTRRSPTR